MEKYIEQSVFRLTRLLEDGQGMDLRDVVDEYEQVRDHFYFVVNKKDDFEIDGYELVCGLLKKVDRLYGIEPNTYNRDRSTGLASALDFGVPYIEPGCPYPEDEYESVYKEITRFMSHQSDDDFLLTGIPLTKIGMEDMEDYSLILSNASAEISDFVNRCANDRWAWKTDSLMFSQYVFDKFAELTYKIAIGIPKEEIKVSFNPMEAFDYYDIDVPKELKRHMIEFISLLEDHVLDTLIFIEDKRYNTCPYEIWLKTLLFNIGLTAFKFVCEFKNWN